MAKRKPSHQPHAKPDIKSGLAHIESFSTEVVEKLNNKWLPDEAGKSVLALLNCLNGIREHWNSLTEEENEQIANDGWNDWPKPKPDPIREYLFSIRKNNWLQIRLPELLSQLGLPEGMAEFLTPITPLDSSSLPKVSEKQLADRARYLKSEIAEGIQELQIPLTRYGREHELPEGWEPTGWNDHWIGIQPVRDMPELIAHLKRRALYINQNPMRDEVEGLLKAELQNARLAIREMIPDPSKWPTFKDHPHDFIQSRQQLENLIDDLCLIQQPAKPTRHKSPSVSQRRLKFHDDCKANNSLLTQVEITKMWCKESGDVCDDTTFRQSIHRARKKHP